MLDPQRFAPFENRIDVTFKDKSLLIQAFTHRSYINEHPGSPHGHNERLEFLGDAVLELAVTEYLFKKYPEIVEKILQKLGINLRNKKVIEKNIAVVNAEILKKLMEDINDYKKRVHVSPITRMVTMLPKEELAMMAESFVNLTSLKRKISDDQETVGGPIDVAIISKGDGFIWVKRKNYFRHDLNQGVQI